MSILDVSFDELAAQRQFAHAHRMSVIGGSQLQLSAQRFVDAKRGNEKVNKIINILMFSSSM